MGNTSTVVLYKLLPLARGHKGLFDVSGKALGVGSPSLFRRLAWVGQNRRSATLLYASSKQLLRMRFEGTLTNWNDDRGFGRIESTQGGEPIFVHVSAWPRGTGRPQLNQTVSFEVELSPKGKRAGNVELIKSRRVPKPSNRNHPAQWGTATLFVIPAFVVFYTIVSILWKTPLWVAVFYAAASAIAFLAYAGDKAAAAKGSWRTQESTLHMLSLAGGWPGALLAQQVFRHKSSKREFRRVFWATVVLNIIALVVLASPLGRSVLGAL